MHKSKYLPQASAPGTNAPPANITQSTPTVANPLQVKGTVDTFKWLNSFKAKNNIKGP